MSFGRLRASWTSAASKRQNTMLLENGRPTEKGKGYQFSAEMVAAVDVAIELGRPLLVSGEPGCGKTELGYAVARQLGIQNLHLFTSKSSSEANELFYVYDALKRFRDAQITTLHKPGAPGVAPPAETDVGDYVEFQALGRAILDAHDRDAVAHLLRGRNGAIRPPGSPPRPSVVVIDEIDKTPRDFPNDLLQEIEAMSFRVREFPADPKEPETPPGNEIDRTMRPIVLITSNEERQLPDAFLRRCVFFEIPFPDTWLLSRIVDRGLDARLSRMGLVPASHSLDPARRAALIDLVLRFRETDPDKRPGVSELLDAAAILSVHDTGDLTVTGPVLAKLKRDKDILAKLFTGEDG
ncbi:MoxR family ATPase [Alsobacter sp. KACC 23698]|uniref:MoxR family ATPase n=1 Tax=Alsobacter sp. KACC 23698 TaxID=3149229 RepID=A0AAU7JBR4_9HYPH